MAEIENRVVRIADLRAHPRNYRRHPQSQVQRLEASVARFGQVRSIVVQRGAKGYLIVAGHGLVQAAKTQGFRELRADVIPADWTPEQVEGYLVADNLHGDGADDDRALLAAILQEQANAGYDLEALGSSADELDALLQELADDALENGNGRDVDDPDGGGDDFDATPDEGPTRTQPGDLWQLGRHRLLCGDSTKREDVARLMDGEQADMMWTDPPYGVSYVGKTKKALTIQNDGTNDLISLLHDSFDAANSAMREGAAYYIAHPDIHAYEFIGAVRDVGWQQARPAVVLWVKDSAVFGRGDYHSRSEPMLYGWKPGAAHHAVADRTQDNVWEIPRPKRSEEHPTMKPVALVARAVLNSSDEGDTVYEPFCGSGTTLIASERLNRNCRAIELDPRYCDVILRRWETETGREAVLLERVEGVA